MGRGGLSAPEYLGECGSRSQAELVKHFLEMEFESLLFALVNKKGKPNWEIYVSGKPGFKKYIKELRTKFAEYV